VTVRRKITLLITAAGFLSSLIFSVIILWEMLEQPFRIMDSDLEAMARRAVRIVSQGNRHGASDTASLMGDERYWLQVSDPDSGEPRYRSSLAERIKIPEPAPGESLTASIVISRERIDLGQDERNEVTFRIKGLRITQGGRTFRVTIGRPMEKLEEELWDVFIGVVSGLAFSGLLLSAISYFVAGLILRPVRIMNEQARDISEKHLEQRLPVTGGRDEFAALAETLNRVFDRLQHAFLKQKRLLADASHELKTPLTMMRLALEGQRSADGRIVPPAQVLHHERLTQQVLRMERLVKNLLDLSALEIQGTAADDPIDLVVVLESLVADYRFLAEARRIEVEVRLPRRLVVRGSEDQLYRALSNILDNAIKYNVAGGRVRVVGGQSGGDVFVSIENTGPGVPEAEIPKLFDPFYRVEKSRSIQHGGAGLGLAIVKKIVELHRGKIRFQSGGRGWTKVTIVLPRHREKPSG
jgi:signal transduction histidine kinase